VRHAIGEGLGLAAARSGNNEKGPIPEGDGLALLRVELAKPGCIVHGGTGLSFHNPSFLKILWSRRVGEEDFLHRQTAGENPAGRILQMNP
jgi:hypothetical protein